MTPSVATHSTVTPQPSATATQPQATVTPAVATHSTVTPQPSATATQPPDHSTEPAEVITTPAPETQAPTRFPPNPTPPPGVGKIETQTPPPGGTFKPLIVNHNPVTPPAGSHPSTPPSTQTPHAVDFSGAGGHPGGWSIQRSSESHSFQGGNHQSANGEWGTARIDQYGRVTYIVDENGIKNNPTTAGEVSRSEQQIHRESGGVINPGGHMLNNNGAVHGNAWWKHPRPGSSEVVTIEIESRSHNEFYDVFKDGRYVGTYQMSADAQHYHSDGWEEVIRNHGGHIKSRTWHDGIDQYSMTNLLLVKLPPEPPTDSSAANSADEEQPNEDSDLTASFGEVAFDIDDPGSETEDSQTHRPTAEQIKAAIKDLDITTNEEQTNTTEKDGRTIDPQAISSALNSEESISPEDDSTQASTDKPQKPEPVEIAKALDQQLTTQENETQPTRPIQEANNDPTDQDPLKDKPATVIDPNESEAHAGIILAEEALDPSENEEDPQQEY